MTRRTTTVRRTATTRRTFTVCLAAVTLGIGLLAGCSNHDADVELDPALSPEAGLGKLIFEDKSLSASGQLACQSCHDPGRAHAGEGPFGVPAGGVRGDQFGFRKAPSIRYLKFAPEFAFKLDEGELIPVGGFFWDGRARSLAEQAKMPFLNPREMANASPADVVELLRRTPYAATFARVYGLTSWGDVDAVYQHMADSLARYQREDPDFAPFDSKFDRVAQGAASFTEQEQRGFELFKDAEKGNCAACHVLDVPDGAPGPLLTDFTYDALGVPRNAAIPENADSAFFDQGLCGPSRTEYSGRPELCGLFKVPSLRNVALTAPYFHNGRFATLVDAIRFYVQRDTNPDAFYPADPDGHVRKFDDLPVANHGNVNTSEVPYGQLAGEAPRLTDSEIDDLAAFLLTLSDGYR